MKRQKIEGKLSVMAQTKETNELTLVLHGDIGPSEYWYDVSLKGIKRALQGKEFDTLNVHINSNGGDVFESIAIANYFKELDATIIIHIDAIAASGGSIIAMAGEKVLMPANTMMMIHNAWTFAAGNAKELRKVADDLDKIGTSFSTTYLDRFVGTEEELQILLDNETLMTAQECVDLGFADEIKVITNEKPEGTVDAKANIFNKYQGNRNQTVAASADKPEESNVFKNLLELFIGGNNNDDEKY